ncbi:hypothetical protein PQR70_17700 [Paraburkholderia madseniana]|uniref:HTH araC/xylS-type domain-containing protein n=1 Tax=Paraburkholderia madseniana TaxID=2599607 RepID=A0AAP5BDQ0_9BURK|nr:MULTISPECIES: hypothetical protein [Paraburkholderia]MCX4146253.1 hypothetical protein [Paraburkholderia madseniana]MDN7149199.1 hypothetical protein [Paraburkholderia sp. WS6]MDQ6408079.1 hypothetical protein [Paraburkholderia madseniana]
MRYRDGSVVSVGLSVGYDSASQFSREYRRMFGASSGKDAERLRGTSALQQAII